MRRRFSRRVAGAPLIAANIHRFNKAALAPAVHTLAVVRRIVDPKTEHVAREIMSYFLRHPVAADSLEGIARWRLMLQNIDRTVDETAAALEALVSDGIMEIVPGPSGEPVYRLNPDRREHAEQLLRRGEENPE